MIAEDVYNIIPNIVVGDIDSEQHNVGIDYSKAVPYLIKVVQMQEAKIRDLSDKVEELKNHG